MGGSIYYVMIAVIIMSMVTLMIHVIRNALLPQSVRKWFSLALSAIILGAVTECIGTWIDGKGVPLPFQTAVVAVEFCTIPFISFLIAKAVGASRQARAMSLVPLLHTLVQIICLRRGMIFYITPDGWYHRGPYYWIYIISYSLSVLFLILLAVFLSKHYRRRDTVTLVMSLCVLTASVAPSALNSAVETSFLGISMMAVLLYVYYSDLTEQDLYQKVEKQNRKLSQLSSRIILNTASLIENRDMSTGAHIRRMAEYVELLARAVQRRGLYPGSLTEDTIEWITEAAPLHDVGKVMIPDSILKKPEPLTREEYAVMKTHTTEGERIVRETLQGVVDEEHVLIASQIAEFHHERWDGKGYPAGLKGENIPLCARIMALADVYEALTADRVYKKAYPEEKAAAIIRDGAGTQFDPVLTDIFLKECIGKKGEADAEA